MRRSVPLDWVAVYSIPSWWNFDFGIWQATKLDSNPTTAHKKSDRILHPPDRIPFSLLSEFNSLNSTHMWGNDKFIFPLVFSTPPPFACIFNEFSPVCRQKCTTEREKKSIFGQLRLTLLVECSNFRLLFLFPCCREANICDFQIAHRWRWWGWVERDFLWKNMKILLYSLFGVFRVIFFYYCLRLSTMMMISPLQHDVWLVCVEWRLSR